MKNKSTFFKISLLNTVFTAIITALLILAFFLENFDIILVFFVVNFLIAPITAIIGAVCAVISIIKNHEKLSVVLLIFNATYIYLLLIFFAD